MQGKPAQGEQPSHQENWAYNRWLWDWYSRRWEDPEFRQIAADFPERENESYAYLGDHWGRLEDVHAIMSEFIFPFVTTDSVVAELGSGGGRLAARIAPRVKHLYCLDISADVLDRVRNALSDQTNVSYLLLDEPDLPRDLVGVLDFLYAFDVFVHLDLHMMWRYIREFPSVLREEGHVFIHTANLLAPAGWRSFASQDRYSVEGHYFVTPEIVRLLLERAGMTIVKESELDWANFYLNRDFLVVAKRGTS